MSKVAKKGLLHTQAGTPYYASPEIWRDLPYDSKSDIWSLGCVLYEAAALHPPFLATDLRGLASKVLSGKYVQLSNGYSYELKEMVRGLLQLNPKMRPSCGTFQATVEDILKSSAVVRRVNDELVAIALHKAVAAGEMLRTIVLPLTLSVLGNQLPKANYTSQLKATRRKNVVQNVVILNNPKEKVVRPRLEREQVLRSKVLIMPNIP